MTVHEVADCAGTSSAGVVRFCRSIGVQGFSDLKLQLSAISNQIYEEPRGYWDIEPNEEKSSVINKTVNNSIQALRDTSEYIDIDIIEQAVAMLKEASIIYVYGVGASSIVADDVALKWLRLGKPTLAGSDAHKVATAIANAPKNAVFFGISYSGNTKEVWKLTELAIKHGLRTLGLSRFGKSKLSSVSELMLYTSHAPEAVLRSGATSSRLSQLLAIDILFFVYASVDFESTREQLEQSRDAIKDLT